jgi:hypothetical protein
VDKDFRSFAQKQWDSLPHDTRVFIRSFFDYQHYDINDQYLEMNELMAHCLERSVPQVGKYFADTIAPRLAKTWRVDQLPAPDADGAYSSVASMMVAVSKNFNNYVKQRWGLAAGRMGFAKISTK